MSKIKGFIGETLVYGLGNVFSRVFAMFLLPLYTEFLGKTDYSNIVMLQSTFTIITFLTVLTGGVFFYYYEFDNLKYKKIVFTTWFYYEIIVSVFICIILWFTSPFLANFFIVNSGNQNQILLGIILIGSQLFPYTINITNINYFRINRNPKKVVLIIFLEALFTLIFVFISLRYYHYGIIGVLVSQLLARLFVSLIFIKYATFYTNKKFFSLKMLNKIFLFSWPFILSSIFSWTIISLDKFVGAKKLTEPSDIAFLALSMQLVIPIAVLADMIRMALGPYIMSIRQDSDSEKSYQQLFEGTIFFASLIVVCLILATPLLTLFLSDRSYLPVISVVPLMAFGQLVSITANQFSICFSLVKKTVYILYSVILGGSAGFIINFFLMEEFGYEVSGYSQVFSYSLVAIFLFYFGKKVANLQIQFKKSSLIITIVFAYIIAISYVNPFKIITNYINLLLVSFITLLLITIIYFVQQKISLRTLLKLFKKT